MQNFRVWFTIETPWGYEEDYLDVQAKNASEAHDNVMDANRDIERFFVQSVEPLE
jgi:hypothetical protein